MNSLCVEGKRSFDSFPLDSCSSYSFVRSYIYNSRKNRKNEERREGIERSDKRGRKRDWNGNDDDKDLKWTGNEGVQQLHLLGRGV